MTSFKRSLAAAAACIAFAVPAWAQSATPASDESPSIGVQFAALRFNEFSSSKVGFDAAFATRPLSQPMSSLGIRAAVVVEGGVHHFSGSQGVDGSSFSIIQGGVELKADKVGTPHFKPTARVMFGIGHGDGETDKVLTLMPGAEFPLENKPYRIRAEIGQVWDLFDGGHQVAWRFGVGVIMPLNMK